MSVNHALDKSSFSLYPNEYDDIKYTGKAVLKNRILKKNTQAEPGNSVILLCERSQDEYLAIIAKVVQTGDRADIFVDKAV